MLMMPRSGVIGTSGHLNVSGIKVWGLVVSLVSRTESRKGRKAYVFMK